ncbi:MAG: ABC transporter ATP-binding protein [Hyphomicrobiaceae bacterium]
MTQPLVRVCDVHKHFPLPSSFLSSDRPVVHALNGVSIDIQKGEAFCLVGESGCGKTTLGRAIIGLLKPTSGEIFYEDTRIDQLDDQERQPFRQRMQMIFQNPYASLNPRMVVQQILEEPLRFHQPDLSEQDVGETVTRVMESVGNDPAWGTRYPHEFSGGQRQRISIARALMVDPEFIVADEPISALDVSIQAQVLNVLMDARKDRNLTYLFITHDLSVVEHFGTRVAVMYLGTVCELAETHEIFANPRHPYTQLLLSAIPKMDGLAFQHTKIPGEVPSPVNLPSGCVFHGRCPHANDRCRTEIPHLTNIKNNAQVACHAVEEGRI